MSGPRNWGEALNRQSLAPSFIISSKNAESISIFERVLSFSPPAWHISDVPGQTGKADNVYDHRARTET